MSRDQQAMRVRLEGGREFVAVVDQRDFAALEATDHAPHVFRSIRFLAWNAARRAGQYGGSWDDFNARECVEVVDERDGQADEQDPEGEQRLDPGRSNTSAAG